MNSSNSALWSSGDYQFDGAGNIKALRGTTGTTYEYDLLGRLAASVGHADVIPTYLRFSYDRLGNMLSTSISSLRHAARQHLALLRRIDSPRRASTARPITSPGRRMMRPET